MSLILEYSFDAWGRRRNPTDWSYNLTNEPALFAGTGFTGHEHLPWFNLINMNGRLYDPLVGRMLSVDNFVQNKSSTQSHNRYSYCLNNPLKYTDPSGYKRFDFELSPAPIENAMTYGAYVEMNLLGGYGPSGEPGTRYSFWAYSAFGGSGGGGSGGGGGYDFGRSAGNGDLGKDGAHYDEVSGVWRDRRGEEVSWDLLYSASKRLGTTHVFSYLTGENQVSNKVILVNEILSDKDAVRNFGGIAGLTSVYRPANFNFGKGVIIELLYISPNVNNTSNWFQTANINGFIFVDDGHHGQQGWYYDDKEIKKHRDGYTITFYDSPWAEWNWNGSKILTLTLYTDNKPVFTLEYGFHMADGVLKPYTLKICNN
jgi:RHS repeat-associated protein